MITLFDLELEYLVNMTIFHDVFEQQIYIHQLIDLLF